MKKVWLIVLVHALLFAALMVFAGNRSFRTAPLPGAQVMSLPASPPVSSNIDNGLDFRLSIEPVIGECKTLVLSTNLTVGNGWRRFDLPAAITSNTLQILTWSNRSFVLSWLTRAGVTYTVQSSFDLIAWTNAGLRVEGWGGRMTTNWPCDDAARFFRLVTN